MNVFRAGRNCLKPNKAWPFFTTYKRSFQHETCVVDKLRARGLVKTITSENLRQASQSGYPLSLYCGVDPTASSLHVGNLLTLMVVLHYYISGHNAVALVGGATGLVGDPAGKSSEREMMDTDAISHNVMAIEKQLHQFFSRGREYATLRGYSHDLMGTCKVVNNADWYTGLTFMHFMKDVGRNIRVGPMLARDSVRQRLKSPAGMSYGEFSYQLLQAYDFWQLHKSDNVRLQVGGSDQYGNIVAGIDLISRLQGGGAKIEKTEVFGLTVPLLTTPSGEKFGKSAGNAVWLDPSLTSPFDLYQYFVKTPDEALANYLRLFTLLPENRIEEVMRNHFHQPGKREANHLLATELTTLVHGAAEATRAVIATQLLFPARENRESVPISAILEAFAGDHRMVEMPRHSVLGQRVTTVLRESKSVKSGKEAQALIQSGGLYLGENKLADAQEKVQQDWLLEDKLLVLRIGKGRFVLISLV